jgi:uncharacterized FAD-dependent dehydrogenase
LWRKNVLNPESNVQFGEGGAGTFSDGKLWSQIKDPKFYGRKVITEFIKAGAPEEIRYVAKPHIGTFRLVGVVERMRQEIIELGGEIRFSQKVIGFDIQKDQIAGVKIEGYPDLSANHVVLALGHSARDTFEVLHAAGVYMEAKPFSVGFRIEHPQSLIDRARLGPHAGNELIGAADYKLVHHAKNGRAVYSFCMCPGGTVVAATSEPNRVVTNGMSQYSRNERNANAGIVVGITPEDYPGGPLAGIEFQRALESKAYELGGSTYEAPGQLVGDFLAGKASTEFGSVIYESHNNKILKNIKPNNGLTIKTLYYWLKQDNNEEFKRLVQYNNNFFDSSLINNKDIAELYYNMNTNQLFIIKIWVGMLTTNIIFYWNMDKMRRRFY